MQKYFSRALLPRRRQNSLTVALWTDSSARRDRARVFESVQRMPPEERANALTHALAAMAFAVVGCGLLVVHWHATPPAHLAAMAVFACSLVLLYVASALYHAESDPAHKARLRTLDHCAIYILIAGSYTPFAIDLGDRWGAALLAAIWMLAALGTTLKMRGLLKSRWGSLLIYVLMGWSVLVVARPFLAHFDGDVLRMLLMGGIAYTLGTPFYALSRYRYMHAVWHLFVILGSTCHLIAAAALMQS